MNGIDLFAIVQSVETLYNPSCSSIDKEQASQILATISSSDHAYSIAISIMESKDPCTLSLP